MEQWHGKLAIVTGASSGIGAAICERLVKGGLQVVGLARRTTRVESLSKTLKTNKNGVLHAVYCDVTSEASILEAFKQIVAKYGPPSILINNAGILTNTNLIDGDTALWKKILDTNVLGLCIGTREAIKLMMANKIDGHIIHINSILGHMHYYADGINVYGASKHAVTNLTEVLRRELIDKKSKIKVTSLSPGIVQTEIFDNSSTECKKLPQAVTLNPMDIADGVAYVLSTPKHVQVHELTIKPIGEPV